MLSVWVQPGAELPSCGTDVRESPGAWRGEYPRCSSRGEGAEWDSKSWLGCRLPGEHTSFVFPIQCERSSPDSWGQGQLEKEAHSVKSYLGGQTC